MSDSQSYKQIVKATSLFGGVQFFNILIQIIRSKIIAIFLGAAGMGIYGLLTSAITIISTASNFGLNVSGVKYISESVVSKESIKLSETKAVLDKLIIMTGILGVTITLILSTWLSRISFGNDDYIWAFIILSISLLFMQLTNKNLVILQGFRKLRELALANVWGNFVGLLITAPLYYIFKLKSIVPTILITYFIALLVSYIYSRKITFSHIKINYKQAIKQGKPMLKTGFVLSISGIITLAASYIIRIYIRHEGNIEEVGLYTAGFAIINTYVGMIFTAMSTDYFPRLAGISNSNNEVKKLVNQQADIAILILAPIIIIFIVFINFVIQLLYSQSFLPVNDMVMWAALGMFFKAGSWCMGFILLAKGKNKIFFWNELAANIYMLGLNVLGYKLGGLEGLGLSFLISYFIYIIQIYIVCNTYFEFKFNRKFVELFIFQLLLAILSMIVIKFTHGILMYTLGVTLFIFSLVHSVFLLNKKLGLKRNIFNRK